MSITTYRQNPIVKRNCLFVFYKLNLDRSMLLEINAIGPTHGSICIICYLKKMFHAPYNLQLSKVFANMNCYICIVIGQWLRPCSARDRNNALFTPWQKRYHLICCQCMQLIFGYNIGDPNKRICHTADTRVIHEVSVSHLTHTLTHWPHEIWMKFWQVTFKVILIWWLMADVFLVKLPSDELQRPLLMGS